MVDLSRGRVIVTYGRSLMALTAARSLSDRGVEVIGADDVDFTALSFSKFASENVVHRKYTPEHEAAYIDDMVRIAKTYKPGGDRPYVLMPMFKDAKVLASHAHRFEGIVTLSVPELDSINVVDPKDALARTASRIGLSAPKSLVIDSEADLEAAIEAVRFPCLIKPADAVGGRGIEKVSDAAELRSAYAETVEEFPGSPVVQEFAQGDDYCYGFLAHDGEVIADMAYRNISNYPADYGAGVIRETIDHQRFREAAAPLIKESKWSGVGQVDFMWTGQEADPAMLIELNPRFWANIDHSVNSGVDFPWLLYESTLKGGISETPVSDIGYRSKLPGLWLLAALEEAGDEGEALTGERAAINARIREQLRSGHLREALQIFTKEPGSGLGLRAAFQRLRSKIKGGEAIETVAADQDDPLVSLGVFFVLGSLLRHGELPPELRR